MKWLAIVGAYDWNCVFILAAVPLQHLSHEPADASAAPHAPAGKLTCSLTR